MAACCNPSTAHKIVGYVTRGGFISIHRKLCKVLSSLDASRLIEARWNGHHIGSKRITVEVTTTRSTHLSELAHELHVEKITLLKFSHERQGQDHVLIFDLQLPDGHDMKSVIKNWEKMEEVKEVRVV